jgi:hypothetical protein
MIAFEESGGVWRGAGARGRQWVITPILTGWRLQFVDPGRPPVNSGTYRTVADAIAGAGP